MKTIYSIIIPSRNEGESLKELFPQITKVMKNYRPYEILIIDDGSKDASGSILKNLSQKDKHLKVITFSTQQGKWAGLVAGLKKSQGSIIITLDGDLQDDPKELPKLLAKFNQKYDLVSGWRKTRQDPIYKVLVSNLGNNLISLLYNKNFHDLNSPFKVYRREVFENLPRAGTMLRFGMLFASIQGYRVVEIPVKHRARLYGKSKFGMIKYIRILYDLVLVALLFSGSGRIQKKMD
jgi:glycosyltransferase involved in cell wall biosynthesis